MKVLTPREVLDAHPQAQVLSLDFFDTLVTRSVAQPTHVFAEMEQRLVGEFGREWKGFARTRVVVEHEVRVEVGRDGSVRDVTHSEIIDALQRHYGLTHEMSEHLRALECACEVEMARVVPFGAELAQLARDRGMRVVIVSDNYMSSQHLADMAHAAGLSWVEARDIFVSSEHGAMKHNGSLWPLVLKSLGVPARNVLHVGDHELPDKTEPEKFGIACHIDARSSLWHRHPHNNTPATLPFSRLEAWQRDSCYETGPDVARHLGGGLVAMMVAAQLKDCADAVRQRDVASLHFAARDGWMAHAAWTRLRQTWTDLPDASYLSFSRSVIGRANIDVVDEKVAIRFIDEHEVLSPQRLSRRFGCVITSSFADDAMLDSATARQVIMDNNDNIVAASRELRQRLVGYLRRSGIFEPGHHIVVDLGWRGAPMADLADIVSTESGGAATIEGRFLGLYWDATMNRVRLPLHGYAMSDLGPLNDNIRLLGAVRILEFLVTAPHGSVLDFSGPDSNFEPIYASQANVSQAEESFVSAVLESAIDGALQIALGTHPAGVTFDDITPESVWAAMMQVAHTPRHDELDVLKQHVHVASVDHGDGGLPLIAPAPRWSTTIPVQWYSRIYDDTMKTRWFQGSLRDWERQPSSHDFAAGVMRLWPFMGPVWCDEP